MGWAKHQIFGLRKEWLELYLWYPNGWELYGGLGTRQVQSLKTWLKTCGLQDGRGRETFLGEVFREKCVDAVLPWELLWVNVVFNFPTAAWYVGELGLGAWTTGELKNLLRLSVPRLAMRTVNNAILELVGMLERTPVGRELSQGEVLPVRPCRVQRKGYSFPSAEGISYAACRLFEREKRNSLHWEASVLWPWVVFGCERKHVLAQLIFYGQKWFTVGENGIVIKHYPEEWWACGSMLII